MSKRGDDADAFAEAVRGAKPLAPDERGRVAARPAPKGPPPRQAPGAGPRADAYDGPVEAASDSASFEVTIVGEAIEARGAGVDVKLLRRLKAGEPRVEAPLDQHGRSREEALRSLERFLALARGDGKRCVLVIHGRGAHSLDDAPVLKPLVWRWLALAPAAAEAVLAFASARPAEGGEGATRLLLRRPGR
ncbi:MAG TPA: Smr/MutS family protein [Polyangia bacterium]|nr:Smr/MutS family protein [Polyangia bacterium]